MPFKIRNIVLQNGESFTPSPITVIVGANNSGKTRLLKEISQYLQSNDGFDQRILKQVTSEPGELDEILSSLELKRSSPPAADTITYTLNTGYFGLVNQGMNEELLETIRKETKSYGPTQATNFRTCFGKACVALIQTEDRLIASKQVDVHINPDQGLLQSFYNKGTEYEKKVSKYIHQVFKINLKLDFTTIGKLALRVGEDFSKIPPDPRDARQSMREFQLLEDQGDGIRSFATTILMLLLTNRPTLLIDEPDAFLHPPQAAELGRVIAELASEKQSIILATHSVDLLRGLIGSRPDVKIIRLSRNSKGTSGHILDRPEIETIIKSPLLSSSRVLDSLFYQGAVISEGDSDRTFYEKIARKYFPSDEVHYTHAHNKQTINKLIKPYVKANIRFAAILDFDILRFIDDLKNLIEATSQTGILQRVTELQKLIQEEVNSITLADKYRVVISNLQELIKDEIAGKLIDDFGARKDEESESRIVKMKSRVTEIFSESDKWSLVKKKGRDGLSERSKKYFDELNSLCRSIGIYIVPCGSLESWLEYHDVPSTKSNKAKWISKGLEWLETNSPNDFPAKDFIKQIHYDLTSYRAFYSPLFVFFSSYKLLEPISYKKTLVSNSISTLEQTLY